MSRSTAIAAAAACAITGAAFYTHAHEHPRGAHPSETLVHDATHQDDPNDPDHHGNPSQSVWEEREAKRESARDKVVKDRSDQLIG